MTNQNKLIELPASWVSAKLSDITQAVLKVDPSVEPDEAFTYVDITSIDEQLIVSPKTYLGKEAPSRARQLIRTGDVLFSTVRTYLKHIAMVTDIHDGQIASTGFCVIRPLSYISNKLVFYCVLTDDFVNPLTMIQRGTSYPAVRDSDILAMHIPLSPLPEQHRIVAKIEELFTRLDAGVEALKKIQLQLKRYRQSVLKSAFGGELTAKWRKAHKGELEPASVLLEKIKAERDRSGKYKELPQLDNSDLPKIPEEWVWAYTNILCSSVRDGTHDTPKYVEVGIPLITSKNLLESGLDFTTARNISIQDHQKISIRSGVEKGDVLFAMIGTIGNPVVVDTDVSFSIKNVGLFKKKEPCLQSKYLKYWLESPTFMEILDQLELIKGTTQKFIPLGNLRVLPVPLAPIQEQYAIVNELERQLSVADQIGNVIEQSLRQSQRLHQSILKKAFEGKLVPQDPNDEPAEKLLELIKAEKTRQQASDMLTRGRNKRSLSKGRLI